MKRSLLAVVFSLLALPAFAQTTTPCTAACVIDAGKTFTLLFDDLVATNVTGYRIYIDGVKVGADIPLSALQAGTVTQAGLIAPVPGAHTIQASAFGPGGESRAPLLNFTTRPWGPAMPTNQRIIVSVTMLNGTVSVEVLRVEELPAPPG